ncbi:hypothetical protein ES707_22084 [subsurface metagenome]
MYFIDNYKTQSLEKLQPFRMIGQQPGVQHIGIGNYHPALFSDRDTHRPGSIAVIGENTNRQTAAQQDLVQFGLLILREGFGRKEIHGLGFRRFQQGLQHRQVVSQGFTRGSRGNQNYILTLPCPEVGLMLVRIEAGYSPAGERVEQPLFYFFRKIKIIAFFCGKHLPVAHRRHESFIPS